MLITKELFFQLIEKEFNKKDLTNNIFSNYEDKPFIIIDDHDSADIIDKKLEKFASKLDFNKYDDIYGFSDEYTICSECGNVIRTSSTCYGWFPNYLEFECDIICNDCIDDSIINDYIETELINNDLKALNLSQITDQTLEELGYIKIN